jgi:vancomycin resistance protein VanW
VTTAHLEPLALPARLTAPPRLTQRHPWLPEVEVIDLD